MNNKNKGYMKTTGIVTGIVSNLVTVRVDGPVAENEICYITLDDTALMAEVIKVTGKNASVQVFESTRGLKNGDKVEFQGRMLEATLGPGLLTGVYDGLLNDLTTMKDVFLKRGEYTDPLDHTKLWDFTPIAAPGDKVVAADWLGEVKEGWLPHKIMVPFSFGPFLLQGRIYRQIRRPCRTIHHRQGSGRPGERRGRRSPCLHVAEMACQGGRQGL